MRSMIRRSAAVVALLALPALLVACNGASRPASRNVTATASPVADQAALAACDGLTAEVLDACLDLASRPARTSTPDADGSYISDPDGIALVAECRADTALANDELYACLTQ